MKRVLAALLLPMLLGSCGSWDWRATGRGLLVAACEGARQCRADGGPGYRPPADRLPLRIPRD
ncbi:MAG: hypothetical protein RIB84_21090 [Sneathiellaceae bacterium]